MKNTKISFSFIIAAILAISCVSCELKQEESSEGKYMVRILDSSKISELERLIDLEKFRPEKVTFKYIFIDSTGINDPNYLPGLTKDNSLQAVLYFDSVTFKKMMDQAILMDYAFATHKKSYVFYVPMWFKLLRHRNQLQINLSFLRMHL